MSRNGRNAVFAERWNRLRYSVRRVFVADRGSRVDVAGISCLRATTCTASLIRTDSAEHRTAVLEHTRGAAWSRQHLRIPPGGSDAVVNGVSCAAGAGCLAVGTFSDRYGDEVTLAWRHGQSTVRRTQNAANPSVAQLADISCTNGRACTAVGWGGQNGNLVERWNGQRWSVQPTAPAPTGIRSGGLTAVSCPSVRACLAVGGGETVPAANIVPFVERWDGRRWLIQSIPYPAGGFVAELDGISCGSPQACTAVGHVQATMSAPEQPLVEHWNGRTWTTQQPAFPAGAETTSLSAVSCTSANDCTAVGGSASADGSSSPLAEHWNGANWTIESWALQAGAPAVYFNDISCSSPSACTTVGKQYAHNTEQPAAAAWNGTSWTIETTPASGRGPSELTGVACPSASTCTAVGTRMSTRYTALWETWNGSVWTGLHPPAPRRGKSTALAGVSCTHADRCAAVGYWNSPLPGAENDPTARPLIELRL